MGFSLKRNQALPVFNLNKLQKLDYYFLFAGNWDEKVQRQGREFNVPLGYNIVSKKNHSVVIKKGCLFVLTLTSFEKLISQV